MVAYVKPKLGYDDALDAFGCHGVAGLWGAVATGLFSTLSVNPTGANGLFYGSAHLLMVNVLSALSVAAIASSTNSIIVPLMFLIFS